MKTPTLSQIEPYRVVVLFYLIFFQSLIWLNEKYGREISIWPTLTKSSGHCWFPQNFRHISLLFQIFFIFHLISMQFFFLNLGMGKIYGFCHLTFLLEHTVFLTNSNYLLLFPDIFHPLKCFFVLLPFRDFVPIYDFSRNNQSVTMSTQGCKWNGVWCLVGGG